MKILGCDEDQTLMTRDQIVVMMMMMMSCIEAGLETTRDDSRPCIDELKLECD
ncbi:hypothetical protein HanIR_Chr09g0396401 [Helianthus annuus]|nr:hypothetical protein HanIR_Chr09g0396401 [Helianthus annuus]